MIHFLNIALKHYLLPFILKYWHLLIVFFLPIESVLISIGFLVFIDLVTGVWASKKAGEKFTSKKLSQTISKALLYQLYLITGYIVHLYLIPDFEIFKVCTALIAYTEFKSISENIYKGSGIDIFKKVTDFFKRKEDELLE